MSAPVSPSAAESRGLFRPSLLVLVSVGLTLVAAALLLLSFRERSARGQAAPLAVPAGDQEVAWLYAATSASSWERFVTAVRRVQADRPDLGLRVNDDRAFPPQTTAVPELALAVGDSPSWLHIRWYKVTSDQRTQDWVKALVARRPSPLAVIGGSSSDVAIDLAQWLQKHCRSDDGPLLLLTLATSDEVREADGRLVPLLSLYPGRTFRFCFTNRQMAAAVTDFIWSQDDLRPDTDPVYVAYWQDDPYSENLTGRFMEALQGRVFRAAAQDWAWAAGLAAHGGVPLDLAAVHRGDFRLAELPVTERIPYSVGSFHWPNRWEADAAHDLTERLAQRQVRPPTQQRPLLVVPATWQPARRFLHGLVRNAPVEARRFIVATGDAIPFNTVYRDRNVAWPIQDLPFSLVFFCHRNPVEARAGFREEASGDDAQEGSLATGTEDLLLYVDMVEALLQAAFEGRTLHRDAAGLAAKLSAARQREDGRICLGDDGPLLFDADGNRQSGTGEHVVCLRPAVADNRLLPEATIAVWAWHADAAGGRWRLIRPPLRVDYDKTGGLNN